ncbi:homeobox protein cut-like 1 isoform X1 [Haliotis rufescens]|uniref:homeobox protein cut-like 1 isoform X1 n=2 Tax=Haliotis rufescens TaxID=6454 RepID=UPI00201EB301|nr:homeobox protein cut-like 1 isoform X1 [Haliotis rufescens]
MAANVQSMCQYWRNFDLQELQKDLDTTATELANRQDESDISRKRLVEQSREFKKNTPEDIRKIVAPVLRSFQGEIDALSKRSKAAEAAFLSIYKKLIDLPDPVPVLDHALQIQKKAQRAQDLELENKQLRETLDEYNHEFAEVKNQEVTIKQLKERLKDHEERLESTAENRAKEKERELQRIFAEKERQLQETQLSVAKKLGEAEQKITNLHSALESVQTELFEVKAKYDEATSAKSDEMDMVMADLERANERAAAAERNVETLKTHLASANQNLAQAEHMQTAPDMEQAIDILKRSNLEVELAAKEKEIAQLVEDVQRLQASLTKLRESAASQVSRLEEELNTKNKAFRLLEERIKSQDDYEEIKRELNIMKSVEFARVEEEEGETTQSPKSLEMLLLEKNKTLQSENTQLKVASADIKGPPDTPTPPSPAEDVPDGATTVPEDSAEKSVAPLRQTPSSQTPSLADSAAESPVSNGVPETPPSTTSHSLASPDAHLFHPPPSPYFAYPNNHMPTGFLPPNVIKSEGNSQQGGLDTTYVAKNVRELLSIHNIGQRLFAKHVLGLSQGTVSELLSKPKSWDKLTEKGRESYRKMHGWAIDERNILALKAISPKKGKACSQPLVSTVPKEDNATEDRINQILNEAQAAMHMKQSLEQQQVANAVVTSIYQRELSKMVGSERRYPSAPPTPVSSSKPHRDSESTRRSLDGGRTSRNSTSSIESEASAQEMVARIYRQELEKLARAAESAGNIAASSMYQQELARIAHQAQITNLHSPMSAHDQPSSADGQNGFSVKAEPPDSTSDDTTSHINNCGPIDLSKPHNSPPSSTSSSSDTPHSDSRHAGSAFFLVRPRINGHDSYENPHFAQYGPHAESLSPLQRMQNIANSLSSRPNLNVPTSKPLRAVLPPITQEQFDKYSNVNTDDLVKKVKETLSQYSISQRLFGENVLGLSQGSVSDLLARPKPWHMLTQKGREPFIRMQIFLEDAEAIPKLVASQYRIPPDKLMRSQGQNVQESGVPMPMPVSMAEPPPPLPTTCPPTEKTSSRPPNHRSSAPPSHAPSLATAAAVAAAAAAGDVVFSPHDPPPRNWGSLAFPSSTLEVIAMTSEIDTLGLTSRVKDVLQFHNLGQKLFGEAVLGLSQGSVSELLSKPKPWHMLSIKGREPFIKMHLWLRDPQSVERLKHYQSQMKAHRRRKSSLDERCFDSPTQPKRPRVFFTEEQKDSLRQAYAQDPYPNQSTIEALANDLGVGVKTVINWFHNHRMRAKQQHHASGGGGTPTQSDTNSIKAEPQDESSNQSDMSSASGDTNQYQSYQNNETSQWMFPRFEPVATPGGQRSPESRNNSVNNEQEMADDKNDSEESRVDSVSESQVFPDSDDKNLPPPPTPASGVNKRKRSNPQRVYEGTQLERIKAATIKKAANMEKFDGDDEAEEKENKEVEENSNDSNSNSVTDLTLKRGEHVDKIEKLQRAIETVEENWEEIDRDASIEKLQKNIESSEDEHWEF